MQFIEHAEGIGPVIDTAVFAYRIVLPAFANHLARDIVIDLESSGMRAKPLIGSNNSLTRRTCSETKVLQDEGQKATNASIALTQFAIEHIVGWPHQVAHFLKRPCKDITRHLGEQRLAQRLVRECGVQHHLAGIGQ
ncbi:MAG: hypothetical protein ABT17_14150 [Rhodanobacter sp. SCN 69-32]|nr:MAG: hypothetical protein ABT17_14150 [Rhodanobacter sp. SCN 69-32]